MGAPPGNYAVVRHVYSSDQSRDEVIVVHYSMSVASADPGMDTASLADLLGATVGAQFGNCLGLSSSYYGCLVALHNNGVVYNGRSLFNPIVGAVQSDECPDYVAAVIQKRSAAPGRSGTGRWFLGCVPEAFTDTNRLVPAGITAYETLANELSNTRQVANVQYTASIFSAKNSQLYEITGTPVDNVLGTQKRRLVRPII